MVHGASQGYQWLRTCLPIAGDMRRGFDLWVGKISWRRKWQPTIVFCLKICLKNSTERVWQATVPSVAKNRTQLNTSLSQQSHCITSATLFVTRELPVCLGPQIQPLNGKIVQEYTFIYISICKI